MDTELLSESNGAFRSVPENHDASRTDSTSLEGAKGKRRTDAIAPQSKIMKGTKTKGFKIKKKKVSERIITRQLYRVNVKPARGATGSSPSSDRTSQVITKKQKACDTLLSAQKEAEATWNMAQSLGVMATGNKEDIILRFMYMDPKVRGCLNDL